MLKKILIGLAVVLIALAAVIQFQPATFRIERSASIAAPAEIVMAQLTAFPKWKSWSPWDALDPAQKETFGGTEHAVGHTYHWSGNDAVGEGKMEILELVPNERAKLSLDFIRPFESHNVTEFTVKAAEQGVTVTWAMSGENNFLSKAFGLVNDMDAMLGKDFEKGLASLKSISEAEAKKAAEAAAVAAAEAEAAAAAAAAAQTATATPP